MLASIGLEGFSVSLTKGSNDIYIYTRFSDQLQVEEVIKHTTS